MGINFGGYQFSEPEALPTSPAPEWMTDLKNSSGIYAILVDDPSWSPMPFRILYFGESSDLHRRATAIHEKFASWTAAAGYIDQIYRALCPMPGTTRYQRRQVEDNLIARYRPPCNERVTSNSGGRRIAR